MNVAPLLLTNVAILLMLAAVRDDMLRGERLTLARKNWLHVAAILTIISAVVSLSLQFF